MDIKLRQPKSGDWVKISDDPSLVKMARGKKYQIIRVLSDGRIHVDSNGDNCGGYWLVDRKDWEFADDIEEAIPQDVDAHLQKQINDNLRNVFC